MEYNFNNEVISFLKDKIDALILKGNDVSKDLSVDEQYKIMKKVISESISQAILNVYENEKFENNNEELKAKQDKLVQFVFEYFEKRFSDYRVADWERKRCSRDK